MTAFQRLCNFLTIGIANAATLKIDKADEVMRFISDRTVASDYSVRIDGYAVHKMNADQLRQMKDDMIRASVGRMVDELLKNKVVSIEESAGDRVRSPFPDVYIKVSLFSLKP